MNEHQRSRSAQEALGAVRREAARRLRWAHSRAILGLGAMGLALVALIFAGVVLVDPSAVLALPYLAVGGLFCLFVALGGAWLRGIPQGKIDRELDRRFELPDLALTAGELAVVGGAVADAFARGGDGVEAAEESPWLERQRDHAVAALSSVRFATAWPVRWPRWSGLSVTALAVLGALLGYVYLVEIGFRQEAMAARTNLQEERVALMEELFKDWEQAQDESLMRLLEEVRPIRERLVKADADDGQRLADLNRVEEIVAAEKARVEAQSLEPHAGQLADAFEKVEGMSALAAALRRKDFEKAEEHSKEAGEELSEADAPVPKGAKEASDRFSSAAQGLAQEGNQAMSESLGQLGEGGRKGSAKKMGQGMKGLQNGLAGEKARKKESKRLSMQLSQLGFCKSSLAGECDGLALPSLFKKPGGLNAGKGSDPNRYGAETALDSQRRAEEVQGDVGEGESEVTTVQTSEGQAEATRATTAVKFQEYDRLSRQAIEDESIPLAHRETIKRYFERIRPTAEN